MSIKSGIQKVELYNDLIAAKYDMISHINTGWRIHTCAMDAYYGGFSGGEHHILVVYEKRGE